MVIIRQKLINLLKNMDLKTIHKYLKVLTSISKVKKVKYKNLKKECNISKFKRRKYLKN